MSPPAKSLFVYGIYLAVAGTTMLVAPNSLLAVFGQPPTHEVWIRVAGMLALFLAYNDIQAARYELTPFIRWSVYARGSAIIFFGAFVLLGFAAPPLLLVGVVDLLAAGWTTLALRAAQGR